MSLNLSIFGDMETTETYLKSLKAREREILTELSGVDNLQRELKNIRENLSLHSKSKVVVKKEGKLELSGDTITKQNILDALAEIGEGSGLQVAECILKKNPTANEKIIKERVRKMASKMYGNNEISARQEKGGVNVYMQNK